MTISGWVRRVFSVVSAVSLFLVAVAGPMRGQAVSAVQSAAPAGGGAGAGGKLKFDAVSIRPSERAFYLKGTDFLDPVSEMKPPPGGLFSWNVQLIWLIDFAYSLRSAAVRRQASQGLPKWAQTEWYTIEARAEGDPSRADVREMVRAMLEERFQLTAHLESREGDVLALEVVKPGLGLKPHEEGAPCTLPAALMDESRYPHAYPPYKGFAPRCGVFNRELSHAGERRMEMLNVTMQQITDSLALLNPVPVVDKTGLQGRYDAVLEFGPGIVRDPDPGDEVGAPMLPAALEKQLGLKLNKQRAQVDVFVMDHIGTLTEN